MKNPVGKPLPLTLLEVMTPCHLHDPKRMALPDDTNDTLGHFATTSRVIPGMMMDEDGVDVKTQPNKRTAST